MTYENCQICKTNPANKKGSHIVPISLIAGVINFDNSLKRGGKELTFSIGSMGKTEVFIGRSVPPEEIEKHVTPEVLQEKLFENNDPLIRDYILCSECEKSLGDLESLFHNLVISKILNNNNNSTEEELRMQEFNIPSTLLKAYFLSIILRASIAKVGSFSLPNSFNNTLQKIFKELFELGVKSWGDSQHLTVLNNYNGTFYCICNQEITSNNIVLFNPMVSTPYQVCLGNFYITFTETKNQKVNFKNSTHFNLWQMLDPKFAMKLNSDLVKIVIVNSEIWQSYLRSTQKFQASNFTLSLKKIISNCFQNILNRNPSFQELGYILNLIINIEEIPVIERYSSERISRILTEYFKNFK